MEIRKGGHLIGEVVGDTYFTHRKPEHFMRKFGGFGISQDIIDQLIDEGVLWVVIEYEKVSGGTITYRCKLVQYASSYKEYIFEDAYNRFGGNPDVQKFVSIADMRLDSEPKVKREVQKGLW